MKFNVKKMFSDNKGFLFFIFAMILMRSAVADWYSVPSSSMYPHLMQGDRVFANRLAYDVKLPFTDIILKKIADPKRGDVVTFTSPEGGVRLIKRVIGLPGDVIEMRDEKLIVNGVAAEYEEVKNVDPVFLTPKHEYAQQQLVFKESLGDLQHRIIVMPERSAMRSFEAKTVPADSYLMLGDNRDNSHDSRFYGMVKRELLTGRVTNLMFSLDYENYYMPRWERTGAKVTP
jgi:signal peptidase I